MKMKLMVDRESYSVLSERGELANSLALNDFVSSTRHDPAREQHRYESRRGLIMAAIRANGGVGVFVRVYDDIHHERPVNALVVKVGPMCDDGLRFLVALTKGGER